jgi:hypothetical protein
VASARGVGERGRARDEYDAISRALPLLDAAGSPGTTLRVSAYISWMGTSCYAAMLQRAGVLTEAAEGAAWSGATTGITRSRSPWWIVSRNAGHGFPDRRTITMPVE